MQIENETRDQKLKRYIKVFRLGISLKTLKERERNAHMEILDISPLWESRWSSVQNITYRVQDQHGAWKEDSREFFTKKDLGAVAVLMYDPHADKVVMVTEQRPISLLFSAKGTTLECPTGGIAIGKNGARDETPLEAAIKEAKQETGCTEIKHIEAVQLDNLTSAGRIDERMNLFVAHVDSRNLENTSAGLESENEHTRVHLISPQDLFDMAAKPEAELIMGTYALALWFKDNYARIRREWLTADTLPRPAAQNGFDILQPILKCLPI